MYAFVDRPLKSLDRGGRLLVWAMRHWTKAAAAGRCPCSDVGPAFHKANLMSGFPHFHMMMALLNRHAVEKLPFGDIDCARTSEGEALLLSLIRTAGNDTSERLADTAALIIRPNAVPPMLIALAALGEALAQARLSPALPLADPDNVRFPHE